MQQPLGSGAIIKPMPSVPPHIENLRPYEPGRSIDEVRQAYGLTRVAKLASNENPLGPSPVALAAIEPRFISRTPPDGKLPPVAETKLTFAGIRLLTTTPLAAAGP